MSIVRLPIRRQKGWEHWFLLTSDWHLDSPHCDRPRLKSALSDCVDRGGQWFSFGDTFDVMGGKWDPRSGKTDVRPEFQRGDYLDAVVQDASKFITPHASSGLVISPGNHETSILRRHETDLVERLVAYTNRDTGSTIRKGTYEGWVLFRTHDESEPRAGRQTISLHYHHGHGGGGPVTQGVIQAQRRAVYLPDANIVCSGHIHYAWQTEFERVRLRDSGRTYTDTQLHLGLSCWKDEYSSGDGYHVEQGRAPRPMGGWWIRMYWDWRTEQVMYEPVRCRG